MVLQVPPSAEPPDRGKLPMLLVRLEWLPWLVALMLAGHVKFQFAMTGT